MAPAALCPGEEAAGSLGLKEEIVLFRSPGWVCVLPLDSIVPHTIWDNCVISMPLGYVTHA